MRITFPVWTSQRCTSLSVHPVASMDPSGENASDSTVYVNLGVESHARGQ